MKLLPALAVIAAALALAVSASAAAPAPFQQIASGLNEAVYVTSAPGDASTLYVVEQRGTIVIVRNGQTAGTFLDIRDRVLDDGERGLLSVAFDPGYAQNHRFYVDYSDKSGDSHVTEFTAANGVGDPSTGHDLLVVKQPYPNHKGGQLQFDRRGFLYVGFGDGGTDPAAGDVSTGDPQNHAQNLSSPLGKLLRIKPNVSGAAWQTVGLGLRNPWRFSFDRTTGNLWIGDVGAARSEEIDFRPSAKIGTLANYGWSRFEGPSTYNAKIRLSKKGVYVGPVWSYAHDGPACAVIGGYVHLGRYYYGDFCDGSLWSFKVGPKGRASTVTRLPQEIVNLSSFGEDANGGLYAVSLDGGLYQLR